jgi:hypothetical protein
MSDKLVTLSQVEGLRQMANDKGVGRDAFQAWLDKHAAKTLDDLKSGTLGLVPPQGARIHCLTVTVKLDRPWQEAVNLAGPNTPDNYNVRKVEDKYPATGTETVEEDLVLLNYPSGDGNWEKALAWAESTGQLEKTVPREVFAVGEQHPTLHRTLGQNPMYAVATKECTFDGNRRACYVWWDDSGRRADLRWVSYFGYASGWFLFRKIRPQA